MAAPSGLEFDAAAAGERYETAYEKSAAEATLR